MPTVVGVVVEYPSVVLPPVSFKNVRVETHPTMIIMLEVSMGCGWKVCTLGCMDIKCVYAATKVFGVLACCWVSGATLCVPCCGIPLLVDHLLWWLVFVGCVLCENCIVDASIFYSLYFCVCAHRPLLVVGVRVLCF